MSEILGHNGTSSRKAVLIAVAAVAMMQAVPFLTVIDSDAVLEKDEAGYLIEMDNPDDDEIDKYSDFTYVESRENMIRAQLSGQYGFLDTEIFGMVASSDTLTYSYGRGEKIYDSSQSVMSVEIIKATGIKLVLTANKDGNLIGSNTDGFEDICEALKEFFGSEIKKGDKITLTGKGESSMAYSNDVQFASVNDKSSVVKSGSVTVNAILDCGIEMELVRAGSNDGKSITITSDIRLLGTQPSTYDYHGKEYSDLKEGDKCTIKTGDMAVTSTGSFKYKIDGKDYTRGFSEKGNESEQLVYIMDNEQITCDDLKNTIKSIPDGSGNVSVGKEYKDFKDAYDEIVVKVVAKKALSILLIGLLVLAAIVAVVVIALLLRKKNQQ